MIPLSESTTFSYAYVEESSRFYSIWCQVIGSIEEVEYGFSHKGSTTLGASMDDDSWTEYDSDWLHTCGDKILTVRGSKSLQQTCLDASFQLTATCNGDGGNSGDLNVRFSKITDWNNGPTEDLIDPPLVPSDYPVRGATARRLSTQTTAVSVILATDHQIRNMNVAEYLQRITSGAPPTYPNADPNQPFGTIFGSSFKLKSAAAMATRVICTCKRFGAQIQSRTWPWRFRMTFPDFGKRGCWKAFSKRVSNSTRPSCPFVVMRTSQEGRFECRLSTRGPLSLFHPHFLFQMVVWPSPSGRSGIPDSKWSYSGIGRSTRCSQDLVPVESEQARRIHCLSRRSTTPSRLAGHALGGQHVVLLDHGSV